MSLPARSNPDVPQLGRSSLFTSNHVHLDEARWSRCFEAKVIAWASAAPLLIVLDSGEAILVVQADSTGVLAPLHTDLPRTVRDPAIRPRPMETCAVFRFENCAEVAACLAPTLLPVAVRRHGRAVVHLSPRALLRFYWRRHALTLGYPAPREHVVEDAMALLRHAVSLLRSEGWTESVPHSQARSRHRSLVRDAKTLMARTIADPHPIAQVARSLHTSPFHLAHVFRSEVGSSPHQYLVQLRLIAALVQLRAGARDLSKLALDLGFSHHSHFTAVFRKATGYTPREVRRMLTAECIADLGIAARCS